MTGRRILWGIAIVLLLAAVPAQGWSQTSDSSKIVAEVGNAKITLERLQQQDSGRLLSAQNALYKAEVAAAQEVINDELAKEQAEKEGVTVPELLKRHVQDKVKDPTEDELKVAYEILQNPPPFSEVRSKLLAAIRTKREDKIKTEYISSLRAGKTITVLLEPPKADVALDGAPVRGQSTAPVLVIEFADYQCPYCQAMEPTLQKLRAQYGDKLKFAYKNFPLPSHPYAEKASEAARCAGQQGKYWEYHDALYKSKKLEVPDLKQQASALGLNSEKFDHCLDSGEEAAAVKKDLDEGESLGITGTPSFFVNGRFLSGVTTTEVFDNLINQELSAAKGDHLLNAAEPVPPAHPGS